MAYPNGNNDSTRTVLTTLLQAVGRDDVLRILSVDDDTLEWMEHGGWLWPVGTWDAALAFYRWCIVDDEDHVGEAEDDGAETRAEKSESIDNDQELALEMLTALVDFPGRHYLLNALSVDDDKLEWMEHGGWPWPQRAWETFVDIYRTYVDDDEDHVGDAEDGCAEIESLKPETDDDGKRLALGRLTALLEFIGSSNVLDRLSVDGDTLDRMLDGGWPWPEGVQQSVEELYLLYADDADDAGVDNSSVEDGGREIAAVGPEAQEVGQETPSASGEPNEAAVDSRRQVGELSPKEIAERCVNRGIQRAAQGPLAVLKAAGSDELQKLDAEEKLWELEQRRLLAIQHELSKLGEESDAGQLAFALVGCDVKIRRISRRREKLLRRPKGWLRRLLT